ncbi:sigma-54-dependent Fis family transcriptional regulator [Aeribacillus pallidus]|uniref:Sigma-54-dependent Fis family transcriptional regulator n=2 Tax=Aeribacillus pallidus TaxID=33936 RepID=A0A165X325_9BACI|nr:sigma-54-dependent Fis family transcriptional regulator [Aeribacillus pallidus]
MEAYNYYIQQLQSKEYTAEILNIVLESAYEGICVVDRQAIIREFNSAYSRFLGVRQEDVIGRKVTDVIENTRLHIVLETGVPERGFIQKINGQDMVVHRIPIWKNQQVIGAIGMLIFEGVSEVYHILQRVQNLYVKHLDTENRVEKSVACPLVKKDRVTFDQIIGNSECLQKVKRIGRRAAKVASTVLITGESGTGKELFAKAIHYNSVYANGPFISVNCSAIPEHLLESELFGYEDGAFTGAKKGGKPGKFEQANKGTIFLDEIGDMPLSMQAKILRVLQERNVERVGGTHSISLDIRVIAATNANLQELVKQGKFRADLFYRLNIIPIHLPPLRERKEDIPKLISYSLEQLSIKNGVTPKQFHQGTIKKMMEYDWPGNVRELLNTVEMLLVLCESEVITPHDLPEKFFESSNVQKIESHTHVLKEVPMKDMMEQHEYELIIQTLAECNGNKAKAARKLGIHRSTLYEKLKKYQLL